MIHKPNTPLYFAIFSIASFILSSYSTKDEITLGLLIMGWFALFISATFYFLRQKNKDDE